MHRLHSLFASFAILAALAEVTVAQSAEAVVAKTFDIKDLTLDVKQESLLRLSNGPEAFKCKDDKENYRTQECEATFEGKNCTTFKIPVYPYQMADCKSAYRPVEALPSGMQLIATIGGNRVKVIRVSFFEGKALKLVFFHEGKNYKDFMEGMESYYGPPSSKVTGSRDSYDDVTLWYRGDQTLKAGAARVELVSSTLDARRRQRLKDDIAAAQARSQAEAQRREQEDKKNAKSDI